MPPDRASPLHLELVALVGDRGVWAPTSDGVRRLPVLRGGGWPSMDELQTVVGVPHAVLLGPPLRYPSDPPTTLHVLTDPFDESAGRPDRDWVRMKKLDSIDAVDTETDVHARAVEDVARVVDEATGVRERPARRADWFRTGWLAEADAWLDDRLAELELRRTGRTETLRMWSLATVLRIPVVNAQGVESGVVLKASCAWFASEPVITQLVANFSRGGTPDVLAIDADRAWMLMRELEDTAYELDLDRRLEVAVATAPLASRLQLATLEQLDRVRAAGCPDRTLEPTLAAFAAMLDGSDELTGMNPTEVDALRNAEPTIRAALRRLAECGIPDALVHGDLHLGNVARTGGRPVIYDWSDACIGHPFVDGVHLAMRVRPEDRPAVYEAFVGPWREAFPDADVVTALDLAKIADRVFHALSYEGIQRSQEDASRWEMAGEAAQFLRQLLEQLPIAGHV